MSVARLKSKARRPVYANVRIDRGGVTFRTKVRVRERRYRLLEDIMTLSADTALPRAALVSLLLSADEASLFQGMKDGLPEGWMIDFEADPEMAWLALVYFADDPRNKPLFTVCRWPDRVGLLVQWMDGIACSARAFEDLESVTSSVLSTIFEFAEARQATVGAHTWADTSH